MSDASALDAVSPAALVLAYAGFAVLSVVLTVIDLRTHRLPNRIVLPAYPAALALLGLAAAPSGEWAAFGRALVAGIVSFGFYLALRLAQPRGMGGGDVKLAGLVGIILGFAGWDAVVVGMFAGFLTGGIYSVALIVARRADRGTAIPFGPWMLLGAWLGLAFHAVAG